jgi:hypothetical protein
MPLPPLLFFAFLLLFLLPFFDDLLALDEPDPLLLAEPETMRLLEPDPLPLPLLEPDLFDPFDEALDAEALDPLDAEALDAEALDAEALDPLAPFAETPDPPEFAEAPVPPLEVLTLTTLCVTAAALT